MRYIFKTWKKATYFKGIFKITENKNRATPIDFPTVFTAYGKAIRSGHWQSCTAINTPDYVIKHYFDTVGNNEQDAMFKLWEICKELEKITWQDVESRKNYVIDLIDKANAELFKLPQL